MANFKVAAIRDKRRAMTISIDDFRNIELRVATVTAAAPHPNADRLLVLTIDLGSEQRQLVAGIRAHYTDQDLIGKQVVVVANLQPASLRGVESQGMLLAASDDQGRLAIVTPEKPVANGAQVK
ncbi:MAG TPA: methionine--tRNA ligase subunit beta [Candidatus Binatia bacterium]